MKKNRRKAAGKEVHLQSSLPPNLKNQVIIPRRQNLNYHRSGKTKR